jgi:hypothetical protein
MKCQDLELTEQLNLGVRFVDLRVYVKPDWAGDEIVLSHTLLSDSCFREALDSIRAFLVDNPSEGIILYVRADFFHGIDQKGSDMLLDALVESEIEWSHRTDLSTLTGSELAGKVLLLTEANTMPPSTPFPFLLNTDVLMYRDIWRANTMEEAKSWVHAYMSSTPAISDRAVLSGVALDGTFLIRQQCVTSREMNRWFLDNVKHNPEWIGRKAKIGIVLIDFADEKTLAELLELNGIRTPNGWIIV